MTKKQRSKDACHCDGWWFPHRKGCAGCREEDFIQKWLREEGLLVTDLGRPKKVPF